MQTAYSILLILHLLGWAVALGATVVGFRLREVPRVVIDGSGTALVTGLLMALWGIMGAVDASPPHAKLAVKLVIAAGVVTLAILGWHRKTEPAAWLAAITALIVATVSIAVLWH